MALWSYSTASVCVKAEVAIVDADWLVLVWVLQVCVLVPLELLLVVQIVVVTVLPLTQVSVEVAEPDTVVQVVPGPGPDVLAPSNGASTIRVGRMPDPLIMFTRWITPGLALSGAVVRKELPLMKANPEEMPLEESSCVTGVSEEFSRLFPTTY